MLLSCNWVTLAASLGVGLTAGGVSRLDALVIGLIVVGLLCHRLRHRLPAGLGASLFVGATSVGIGLAAFGHRGAEMGDLALGLRLAALLCVLWAFFGWLDAKRGQANRNSESGIANSGKTGTDPSLGPQSARRVPPASSTFFAWSLVCGIAAVVLILYVLVFATWSRLLDPDVLAQRLSADGVLDLTALTAAALFWRAASFRPQQPVVLLILLALSIWWTGLTIPPGVGSYESPVEPVSRFQPSWWTWTFHLQFGLTALVLGAAVLQDVRHRSRRRRAWPDHLDDLLTPYSRWPAYIQTEAVLAAVVLIIGVYHIVRPYPTGWQLTLANFPVTLTAGVTCLFMTYRRWSGNTAGLGFALVSLAAVALACVPAWLLAPQEAGATYADRIPVLHCAILFALSLMVAWWAWLADVWDQQLLRGVPWTTTGRMIPHARRGAFLLAALAALVAFQMALWPRRVLASVEEVSATALATGLAAMLLLAFISGRQARKGDSLPDATLCLAFLIAATVFVFVRVPPSPLRGWLIQHEAVVLSAICLPLLVVAEALQKTRWRSFSVPLWLLALLILPLRILLQLLPPTRLPAEWIRPMALALLGALYSFAGSRENRRAILVLGVVLLLAALTTLYDSYGEVMLSAFFG